MGHRPFKKPVFLHLNGTGNYQARSAWEALEYLDLYWPATHTAHFRRAQRLCQEAVDGMLDAEVARLALVDAAQRAGLLRQGWHSNLDGSKTVFRPLPNGDTSVAA
jgi:Protein of unknown function (DUF982).